MMALGIGFTDRKLSEGEIESLILRGLNSLQLRSRRVLVIIPDGTRTMPMPLFFPILVEGLRHAGVKKITFLIALGTHPPMSLNERLALVGLDAVTMDRCYDDVRILNHRWQDPSGLSTLGTVPTSEIASLSEEKLNEPLVVRVNQELLQQDHIILCGPVFPHEVVGFSGGNKYFFPGVSGPEVIDLTHWLGALLTCCRIIGKKNTPVRAVIDRAAAMIPIDRSALCCVIDPDGGVAGLYIGESRQAWAQAASLSSQLHILWKERPYRQVLSVMPGQYEDLWTAAKGMYKVEPVVADGGEVIIFAPHIHEISATHGEMIRQIGYHVLDYFLNQWDHFCHIPRTVLAHSTHVRGTGSYQAGVEHPRIRVTLATQIPKEICENVGLGYRDPATICIEEWSDREAEGILLVPNAGEILYRLKDGQSEFDAR